MQIIDRHTGKTLSPSEILEEVNRDHSADFKPYTMEDLTQNQSEVLDWIDTQYFNIIGGV